MVRQMAIAPLTCKEVGVMWQRAAISILAMSMVVFTVPPATILAEMTVPDYSVETVLLEPGAEPHRILRYDWVVGHTEAKRLELRYTSSTMVDGQVVSGYDTPPFRLDATVTVTGALGDGTFVVETTVTAVDLVDPNPDDPEALALLTDLETLVDLTLRERLDDHGSLVSREVIDPIEDPSDLHPARDAVTASIGHLTIALPEEPVGLGGVWRDTAVLRPESGPETTATIDKTLTSDDGEDVIWVDSVRFASNRRQQVDSPDGYPEGRMTFEPSESTGTARSRIDLGNPIPTHESSGRFEFALTLETEDATYAMTTSSHKALTVVPRGGDDPDWPTLPPFDSPRAAE